MWSRATIIALTTILLLVHFPSTLADAQCYAINGQKSSGTPCNAAATGQADSHAACCDESKQEACLATGVCFATQRSDNNTFWAEGCTDPTGLDPACPQYCGTASPYVAGAPVQPTYTVLSCGGSAWCCCFDSFGKSCNKTDCCAQKNFTLARGMGAVVRQFTSLPTSSNSSSPSPSPSSSGWTRGDGNGGGGGRFDRNQRLVTVIVAGVLGALLLASLVAFAFSCSRARQLRRQVDRLQQQEQETLVVASSLPPSSTVPSPLSPRVRSLRINTQGLAGPGLAAPHTGAIKDDVVSPMSHEQQQYLHLQQQQLQQQQYSAGGVRRSSSSSFHQPPPPFTQRQQYQNQPYAQQQLNGYSFNAPPRTPSWTHTNSTYRHDSIDNNMNGNVQGHSNGGHDSRHGHNNVTNTAELASPMNPTELPTEKYTY
ncbi:hypothetical protein Sste5346_000904 [Sporothrix stenoceras]|uniref:Uncharacterized protein n=1 Tax=Sporothrix stenoceras TaxID=5173 RepID=A0ABR3ZRV2_9PEZI